MGEKSEVRAVEMVRRIRDNQAETLAGKSDAEVIEFYRRAGERARRKAEQMKVRERPGRLTSE